jgi:hypothetical protein
MPRAFAVSTALRALLRTVARVYKENSNPSFEGLVVEKPLQLGEGPRVEVRPLSFALLCPLSNVGEFFESKRVSWFEGIYDAPADCMVYRGHLPALLALKAFHQASSTWSPFVWRFVRKLR